MATWHSLALAAAMTIGLSAGAAANPMSPTAGAIGAASSEMGDLIEVKKGGGGKHFKHGKARHHHGWHGKARHPHGWHRGNRGHHYGWYRGRHRGWYGHYARSSWHCHNSWRGRYCHAVRHWR